MIRSLYLHVGVLARGAPRRLALLCAVTAASTACGRSDPISADSAGMRAVDSLPFPARQVPLAGVLRLEIGPPPWQDPQRPERINGILITAPVFDSAPAVTGMAASVLLESDRGFRRVVPLLPSSCLARRSGAAGEKSFPGNFDWFQCDQVVVVTSQVFDPARLQAFLSTAGATHVRTVIPFKTMPGASYTIITPPAIDAAARVQQRLQGFGDIVGVAPLVAPPACAASLDVPPPPCPPWVLFGSTYYTYGAAAGDTVPVSHGGLVRVTYTQPNGTKQVQEMRLP